MGMRIAVTGAAGFAGRNLVEYLQARHETVIAVTRQEVDLLCQEAVMDYFSRHQVEVILHCAAVGGSRKTGYDAQGAAHILDANTRMFFNLERCLHPGMRMIHFGSGAEYDRLHWGHKMQEEEFGRHIPNDAYGYAKYLISRHIEYRPEITCLRILGLFGKYEDYRYKFISNAIVKNLLRLPIVINQNVLFDYLYVDDFVAIVDRLLRKPLLRHRHYNLTPTISMDLVSIAKMINRVSDCPSEIRVRNPGWNREYTGDNARLLAELGGYEFAPGIDAVEALYRYYAANLDGLDLETVRNDPYLEGCLVKK